MAKYMLIFNSNFKRMIKYVSNFNTTTLILKIWITLSNITKNKNSVKFWITWNYFLLSKLKNVIVYANKIFMFTRLLVWEMYVNNVVFNLDRRKKLHVCNSIISRENITFAFSEPCHLHGVINHFCGIFNSLIQS